jgi:hypothetical protein
MNGHKKKKTKKINEEEEEENLVTAYFESEIAYHSTVTKMKVGFFFFVKEISHGDKLFFLKRYMHY